MRTTFKRIFAGSLLTAIVIASGMVTILLFPEPLFANKLEHGQFKVYSNNEIDENIVSILDNAIELAKKSELYDPAYKFDAFFSYNSFFNKIDDKILGQGPSARATDNNLVIKVNIDAKRDLFFPAFRTPCQSSLTYLVTHEMIHCLQEHKYGKLKFNPFRHPDFWKLEGYPEYIARQPKLIQNDYSLNHEIDKYVYLDHNSTDLWIEIEEGACEAPKYYYKGRLMIEYLMDIRHLSYDKILGDTISGDRVFAEMIKWNEEIKAGKN
jgi:hypothetical protein